MKRKPKDAFMAWVVGAALGAIGILLWAYPMPTMFPIGQNVVAGVIILMGVLAMIFGDPHSK